MDNVKLINELVYYEENPSPKLLAALNEPDELATAYNTVEEMMADLLSDVEN